MALSIQAPNPECVSRFEPDLGLIYSVADRLAPFFTGEGRDLSFGRGAALETITAYQPRQRMDYADIARHIAFSLASLTALGQAAKPGVPEAMQLRFMGKANILSRSADQAHRALTQRALAARRQTAQRYVVNPGELLAAGAQAKLPDAQVLDLVDEALGQCQPVKEPANTPAAASPAPQPTPDLPIADLPSSAQPAPIAILQKPVSASMRKPSVRQTALHQSAIASGIVSAMQWDPAHQPKYRLSAGS